jgi:hypothetical protein
MAEMPAGCMEIPGDPGRGTDSSPGSSSGGQALERRGGQSCAVSVARAQRMRLPGASASQSRRHSE